MPFKSEKQRRYLHINKPSIAKAWEKKYALGGSVKKLQGGGMDASKKDFKTPAQAFTPSPGDTGGEGGSVTNTNTTNTTGSNNVTTPKKGLKIPIVGPVTLGINLLQNIIKPKTAKHPFSANTVKQTKTKTIDQQ